MSPRPSARTEVRRNNYKVSVESDEGRRRRRGARGCRPKFSRSRHLSNLPLFIRKAVWALGNFSGASPRCHGLALNHEALVPLLGQLNEYSKLSMLRHATRTFCRGKPQPPFKQVKPALLALEHLVYSNGEGVLTDACWAFTYLSDGTNDKIQAVSL